MSATMYQDIHGYSGAGNGHRNSDSNRHRSADGGFFQRVDYIREQ